MTNSSVRISEMNLVICVACGLGMKETPKLQRNLGSRHKGYSTASTSFFTWKELSLTIHGQSLLLKAV